MKKYIIKSKLIKLSILSVVTVGSISVLYLTYNQPNSQLAVAASSPITAAASSGAELSLLEELSEQNLPLVVKPEQVETPEKAVDKQVDELVADRKAAIATGEVPSRSKVAEAISQQTGTIPEKNEPEVQPVVEPQPAKPAAVTEEDQPAKQPGAAEDLSKYDTTLNSYVLQIINTYPIGRYPYLLNNDYANYNGVTANISYQGQLLLKAHPSGKRYSHCSGITFEVFFRAMQERNKKLGISPDDFNGMTPEQLEDFIMNWYVANGDKQSQNAAKAVEKYGLGRRISRWEDARAGDFIDISRENNTGHTVVFIKWLKNDSGKIIGLKYWSSQESTQGISYKEEYFNIQNESGVKYGNVMTSHVYIARVSPTKDYK